MARPLPKERLACACFVLESYTFREDFGCRTAIPVPINKRVFDYYNELLKETPRLRKFLEDDIHFLTTHGRIVADKEARRIAIDAGQLDDDKIKGKDKLYPDDIWELPE